MGVAPGRAYRPDPGGGAAVGRLGPGDRPGVQLHERHHPPLLHGCSRARHRRAGRHRRDGPVAGPARTQEAGRASRSGFGHRGQCGVGLRAARPDAGLAALAALGGGGRGRGRRGPGRSGASAGRSRPLAARAAGAGGPAGRACPGRRARRSDGYALDTVNSAHTGSIPKCRPAVGRVRRERAGPRRRGRIPRRQACEFGRGAAGTGAPGGTGVGATGRPARSRAGLRAPAAPRGVPAGSAVAGRAASPGTGRAGWAAAPR